MSKSVHVSKVVPRFKLLKPVKTSPGQDNIRLYSRPLSVDEMERYILTPAARDLCAIDIETRGLSPFYPHICAKTKEPHSPSVVTIGLAYPVKGGYKAACFDPRQQSTATMTHFYRRLSELHLIAHNAMFDGLWLRHEAQKLDVHARLNWVADTFGLFKQLAGQDFIGQSHGLKAAQVDLLGWDEKGDVELDEWLIANEYYTESGKKGERVKKAMKGEMWRVPYNILARYCGLDCISTLQLFDKIFQPVMERFPMLWDYHDGPYIRTIQELIDQQIFGVNVNTAKLHTAKMDILDKMKHVEEHFFELEEIRPHLEEWRDMQIAKITEPKKFKKALLAVPKFSADKYEFVTTETGDVEVYEKG